MLDSMWICACDRRVCACNVSCQQEQGEACVSTCVSVPAKKKKKKDACHPIVGARVCLLPACETHIEGMCVCEPLGLR